VPRALAAAEKLAAEGVEIEVVDLRTLTPLDIETVYASVRKTMRLLVLHEAVRDFGPGAEIAARVAEECFDSLDAPIMRIGGPYTPVPFSPVLENFWLPSEDGIIAGLRQLLA
jgi:pyruvate/2-oxoglutarate/acetoin dehydrogenase E1 component